MRLARIFQTAALRLSLAYGLLFAASSAVVFVVVHRQVEERSEEQLEDAVKVEADQLVREAERGGVEALAAQLRRWHAEEHRRPASYLLLDADGRALAGDLRPTAPVERRKGWQRLVHRDPDGDEDRMLGRGTALEGGAFLFVAAETEDHDELMSSLARAFAWAAGLSLLLAIAGGVATSMAFLRRLDGFDRTAGHIMGGALGERIPVRGSGDEFDRLAVRLNGMLDRVQALVESLRQVSTDVAHDLRTPLTRLRHGLEAAQREATSVEAHRAAIDRALVECDQILATFGALLRIAQIEAGTRRAGFAEVELSALFESIAETYAPVAEDAGHALSAEIEPGLRMRGDRDLLTQMLANLLDNAIQHTPPGTRIRLTLARTASGGAAGAVVDDGPGVPEADRARVFGRMVRLDSSRSTPGNGLGLSLVAAVAELHGLTVELTDGRPGAVVRLDFPATMGGPHA